MKNENNPSLVVYKASAGSGKTFTLAVEYLELLLNDPYAYRNTLAVTFTNKATAEMKNRILSQLYGLAHNLPSSEAYKNVLKERNRTFDDTFIQTQAQKALKAIIHDYSRFRIETIDSFFQRVTKQLAHELKLSASFNIELDAIGALDEAVDTMLEGLHNDSELMEVIIGYIEERLSDDKSWKVQSSIKRFATHIFDESFAREEKKASIGAINRYKQYLLNKKDNAQTAISEYVQRFDVMLSGNGLTTDDFSRGDKGPCGYFVKLKKGKYSDSDCVKDTYTKAMNGPEAWTKKASPKAAFDIAPKLSALLSETESMRKQVVNIINTVDLAVKDLNNLSLFGHITKVLLTLNEQKNRFLLVDTNNLLREMIGNDDPSFIYEKIGTIIEHIMIDEFQDTSSMQWENFSKLLKEGLALGQKSLIVGDVKQSIYRWRGGDWNILNSELEHDIYPYSMLLKTLDTNRRSANNIIMFNNELFPRIVRNMNRESLTRAYSDVQQKVPENRKKDCGYVKIVQLNKEISADDMESTGKYTNEEYYADTIARLADEVRDLIEHGLPMNDICILLRWKKSMPDIARYFAEHLPEVSLVSEEAFRLDSSQAITTLIAALRYLNGRNDKVARAEIALYRKPVEEWNAILLDSQNNDSEFENMYLPKEYIDRFDELLSMPLYELVENLIRILGIYDEKNEQAHICFFLDALKKFMQDEGADIESFINYWDENLSGKTISGGAANGTRIMTIHKSKGLQAHTVLIPFCDWPIIETGNGLKQSLVWCGLPEGYECDELGVLPVTYGTKMESSAFRDNYEQETEQMVVDNINLLYVALTRAENNLIIFTRAGSSSKDNSSTVGEAILSVLSDPAFDNMCKSKLPEWEFGNRIYESKKGNGGDDDNPLTTIPEPIEIDMQHTVAKVEFRQSNKSMRFQEQGDTEQFEYIQKGVLMHELFASLRTGSDKEIDTAIRNMENEGLITDARTKAQMKSLATARIEAIRHYGWFDKDNRLYNECKLLFRNENDELEQNQPDRVTVRDNTITVIDFKFGKPKDEYTEQVKRYMRLLSQTTFNGIDPERQTVKGYIWYVYDNKVTEVK